MITAKAFAPATISNLGSGFDLLGLALNDWGDEVIVRPGRHSGPAISKITKHKDGISLTENSALTAVQSFLLAIEQPDLSVDIEIKKGYPHSSGLGSSAASAVAAVMALNAALKKPFKEKKDLLPFALTGERFRDPGLPADNVAASLLGGIVLSHPSGSFSRLPHPGGMHVVVYRPMSSAIATSKERVSITPPATVQDTVEQTHAIASLVLGLYQSNWDMIRTGLVDHWIEPQRAPQIKHFQRFSQLAKNHDALGVSISGSGPATFAIFMNSMDADRFAEEWFHVEHISVPDLKKQSTLISPINNDGAFIC